MKKTIQEQISELTAKHEFEQYVNSIFPDLEKLIILHYGKKRIVIKATNKEEFKQVLTTMPPTNKTQVIGSSTAKEKELNLPYRIDIENPCSPNTWSKFLLKISYHSNDIEINIALPIEEVNEFVTRGQRGITESEYHYFPGTSHAGLQRIQVQAYSFKSEQIGWYGGDKTLLDETAINSIISFLSN